MLKLTTEITGVFGLTIAKVGNDRKNRHSPDMDRYYCSMLFHQVSAYLVFIINRYEQKYVDDVE